MNKLLQKLEDHITELAKHNLIIIAGSGGFDSLLLAYLTSSYFPANANVVHIRLPYVFAESSRRLYLYAVQYGWALHVIKKDFDNLPFLKRLNDSSDDDQKNAGFLESRKNICYFCKDSLFQSVKRYLKEQKMRRSLILTGTNADDLLQYRPGLRAEEEHEIKTPFADLGLSKQNLYDIASFLGLPFADLPGDSCLATRIYRDTKIDANNLTLVQDAENWLRKKNQFDVLRCRLQLKTLWIETLSSDREKITPAILAEMQNYLLKKYAFLESIKLYPQAYSSGRVFQKEL